MSLYNDVNRDYESLLVETDPKAQMAELERRMADKGMQMEGKAFPTFLKPYFVDMAVREEIAYATERMIEGIETVGRAYTDGYDFGGLVHLEGRTADLTKVDPLYPNYQVMVRLDVFFDPHTGVMQFIEFNCGDPSGMGWHDAMLDMFMDLPAVRKLGEKYTLHADYLMATQLNALLAKYAEFCTTKGIEKKDKPVLGVVCKRDSTIRGDFDLFAEFYREKGYDAYFADPRDFAYDGKRLSVEGHEIDALYRDALEDIIDDKYWSDSQAFVQAYRDGNVCVVNPVRAATGDFKTLPALMTDVRHRKLFTDEVWEAAKKYVPWTRLVRDEKTDFHGDEVNLISFSKQDKDRLVYKPNVGYGGFGILIGNETDQATWDKAIDSAIAPGGDAAVQELLDIPREKFPVLGEDGSLKSFEDKNVNINYWSHGGKFAGAFLRAAEGTIINVHQGGGMVPVLFVEAK
jgi:hypothetical protein